MSGKRSLRAAANEEGFFWAIASDDQGHGGASPPIVLFRYAPGRSGAFAEQFPQGFGGQLLQCDGYDGYERLTRIQRPQRQADAWAQSPIAEAAVRQIAALYAVETTMRGMPPENGSPRAETSRRRASRRCAPGSKSSCG